MTRALGLDFGTANTVLAMKGGDGRVHPVPFIRGDERFETLRSALCYWKSAGMQRVEAGPWAISQYVDHPDECRFLQSLKTFAASRHFQGTVIFGKRYQFEDLLAAFFERVVHYGAETLTKRPPRLVAGRPVTFAGGSPDEPLALRRYEGAFRRFGFTDIHYVYEPVAAAFFYARTLQKSTTILVADSGGGTTDFSIMHFDVSGGTLHAEPLAHTGIGIAGDHFDFRIIDNIVLPLLGKGSSYTMMNETLEMPRSLFVNFARWNLLSVLKTSSEFSEMKRLLRWSHEPDKLRLFIDLVDEDQGYPLYKAVSDAKTKLSSAEATEFAFAPLGKHAKMTVQRADFEEWIAPDLQRIEDALDAALQQAGLNDGGIGKVFLTGGTSFVPAFRRLFERRFGPERIESGSELLSIASGLALIGERDDIERWTVQPG
jgi:hypothetical chaperone protein